jgi:hypothetical protein
MTLITRMWCGLRGFTDDAEGADRIRIERDPWIPVLSVRSVFFFKPFGFLEGERG